MEYALIAIYGAFLRRWWGGWLNPNSTLKRAVVAVVALSWAYIQYQSFWPSLIAGGITIYCFMMHDHGYGMGMGYDGKRPLWKCLAVMTAQYGGAGLTGFLALRYGFNEVFLPLGFVVPFGYWAAWAVWRKYQYSYGRIIDGPTAIGEMILGACLFLSMWG